MVRARKLLFGGPGRRSGGGHRSRWSGSGSGTARSGLVSAALAAAHGAVLLRCRPVRDGAVRRRRRADPAGGLDGQLHGSGGASSACVLLLYNKHTRGLAARWSRWRSSSPPSRSSPAGSRSRSACSPGSGSAPTTPNTSPRPARGSGPVTDAHNRLLACAHAMTDAGAIAEGGSAEIGRAGDDSAGMNQGMRGAVLFDRRRAGLRLASAGWATTSSAPQFPAAAGHRARRGASRSTRSSGGSVRSTTAAPSAGRRPRLQRCSAPGR